MNTLCCGFVGLGLIGGSIAKAIKENIPDTRIVAYDINADALALATRDGIVDIAATGIDHSFDDCDYIFLCAPVQKNDALLAQIKEILPADCILTDVGSVKGDILDAVKAAGLENQFVGGHPMAGSERIGYVNSKSMLLQNAYYILSPTEQVSGEAVKAYSDLVQKMGAIPLVLSADTHDYVTAAVSHLPHVIAASLVNLVHDNDSEDGLMKMIAAGGFKDITRIASSSAVMWQEICMTNTENIITLLDKYMASLADIRSELTQRDSQSLYDLFSEAKTYRDSFMDASSGPIKRSYSITVDIADEPGALASIATILALHQISIKNIGIVHNREYEGGVLKIEFYGEDSIEKAVQLLNTRGYTTYLKK
ncbi:MAG: prephenate dehydrogenase [Lachnospiraceae bacterium]|nr:prephenate dehydrogenase [Lachnospiraceae bacterium]